MTFRSRVIAGYSRELGCIFLFQYMSCEIDIVFGVREGKRLAPPVSVKDRSLPGPVIEFELY